jgi:hypothetical protein
MHGTLSLLGHLGPITVEAMDLLVGRKTLSSAGSGGRPATAEMLQFCADNAIAADVEVGSPSTDTPSEHSPLPPALPSRGLSTWRRQLRNRRRPTVEAQDDDQTPATQISTYALACQRLQDARDRLIPRSVIPNP